MGTKLLTAVIAAVIAVGIAGPGASGSAASPVTAFSTGGKISETKIGSPLTPTKGDATGPMYRPKLKAGPRKCWRINCSLGQGTAWRKPKAGKRGVIDPHPTHPKSKIVPPLRRGIGGLNPRIYRP